MASSYNTILGNIQNAISSLTSSSNLAVFSTIARTISITIDNTVAEINNTISIITGIIGSQRYGRALNYVNTALQYQVGVSLSIDPITLYPYYSTVDPTLLLITKAAFEVENSGGAQILTLKVVKTDPSSNNLVRLSSAELSAFSSYFQNFQLPGIPIKIISIAANLFDYNMQITYYSTYDLNLLKSNIANALTSFRNSFDFNGVFFANDLETYIKNNVGGIRNCYLSSTYMDGVSFSGSTKLSSGYFNYNSSTVSYAPI